MLLAYQKYIWNVKWNEWSQIYKKLKQVCSDKVWICSKSCLPARCGLENAPQHSWFLLISFIDLSVQRSIWTVFPSKQLYESKWLISEITQKLFLSLKSSAESEGIAVLKITVSMCPPNKKLPRELEYIKMLDIHTISLLDMVREQLYFLQ